MVAVADEEDVEAVVGDVEEDATLTADPRIRDSDLAQLETALPTSQLWTSRIARNSQRWVEAGQVDGPVCVRSGWILFLLDC